ncbi:unnamed protein product [Ectocarpus sp. 12 AP-2014]
MWRLLFAFAVVAPVFSGFVVPILSTSSSRDGPAPRRATTSAVSRPLQSGSSSPAEWAVIFDCDGVILESESLHREAYNAVFREFAVDYEWSPEYYDELQNKVGGGKPKMRYYFGENGWPRSKLGPPPETDQEKDLLIDSLQDRKTDIYKEFVADGTAVLRPGVQRLIDETKAIPGGKMAICSASTKDACLFVLDNLLGEENLSKFDLVLAGDDVPRRKPDPMIYALASEKLGVPPERCMVIEDSLIGLEAALGAKMNCVITYTGSTESQARYICCCTCDFAGSLGVYPELGDEGTTQVRASELLKLMGV